MAGRVRKITISEPTKEEEQRVKDKTPGRGPDKVEQAVKIVTQSYLFFGHGRNLGSERISLNMLISYQGDDGGYLPFP